MGFEQLLISHRWLCPRKPRGRRHGTARSGGDDADDEELRDAKSWDALFGYVYEMRAFERDGDDYKEQRAVACFNAAGPMTKEYKRLKPNAEAAVCHVAQCIVPRQVHARDRTRATAVRNEYPADPLL